MGGNSSSYIYGADGYRHRSVVNGTSTDFVLDGDNVVQEMHSGTATVTYLGSHYRRDDTTNTVRWYVQDGLGSVLAEVDPNGVVTGTRKLDVYGISRGTGGTLTSRHGFVGSLGHTSEAEIDLIYMRARYYDPVVGRFVSEDPEGHGDNWYLYGDGNPVTRVDRSGLVSGTTMETTVAVGQAASIDAADGAAIGILMGRAEQLAILLMAKYAALGDLIAAGYAKAGVFAWQFEDAMGKIHLFRFDVASGLLKHTSLGSNLGIPHHTPFEELLGELISTFG